MSAARRYPTAEAYEQRSPAFYNNSSRTHRSYDELDLDVSYPRHGDPRHSTPDFLRDDYGRSAAGPLVVRSRESDYERAPARPRTREIEKEEIVIQGRRGSVQQPPSRGREVEREEIVFRHDERSRPRQVEKEQTEVVIRHREDDDVRSVKSTPRPREYEREEIVFRHGGEPERPRPREVEREEIRFRHSGRGEMERPPRGRNMEQEEIIFRHQERDDVKSVRARSVEREEITFRRDERQERPRERERERETISFRHRERSQGPPRGNLVAREHEEFIVRRREPSPPPMREVEKEEIIIRRREQSPPPMREVEKEEIIIRRTEQRAPTPEPEPVREPTPPPPVEPIIRPPIIQEIITHHRHIDHGVERARSPTPPPPPPSPPKEELETLEVSVRRSNTNGRFHEDEIVFEHRETDIDMPARRHRSMSAPRRRSTVRSELDAEAEFYNRKATERSYIGEAYNGATKDWAILDVPPGTERVTMDGVGGASQEVTWQRYNGVRRARFMTEDGEYASDFGIPPRAHTPTAIPPPPVPAAPATTSDTRITIRKEETTRSSSAAPKGRSSDMWTEITKDLVIREAIDSMGYACEETEYFFYVMECLQYEDVVKLVERSDAIRRERRARIREIQWEREEIESRRKSAADDRIYEREFTFDSRRGRYR